ncbi:flagellar basal body P-ring formation chaperone FlgA [Paraglaciecola sp. L3A3]|uniref:flagellar basal body P-ring formation chaperone FlgA n=1 Tax=Paraglaciecola sp. L3A3 TaxID=2686358 RepID=UPI00131A9213|nr:flagellar basal body P-ring formation chaperone FlgA [Paraglaciecola sp. L3A3]
MKKSYYYPVVFAFIINILIMTNVIAAESENNLAKVALINQAQSYLLSRLHSNTNNKITVEAMPIDDRIHIPMCPSGLTFTVNEDGLNQSNISVKAQCIKNGWYMFLVIKAIEIQPVVVLSSAISPGTLLTENNVHVINMDKKRLRSTTFADINEVIGARMKRRAIAGRPIEPSNLCYVCKGDSVTISANTSAMQVKTTGIALEDGNMGDTISVRNSRSNKRIKAVVADTGQVEINI